jgi:hypothetical protein
VLVHDCFDDRVLLGRLDETSVYRPPQRHPEVLEWGYQTFAEVDEKVRQRKIQRLTAAAHLVHVGRVIEERAKGILVSIGISKEETEKLGFSHAKSSQEALEIAFSFVRT